MMIRRIVAVLSPLLLWGCVLTPGKFASTLSIGADRSFTFTYKGEVIALDPSSAMKGLGDKAESDGDKDAPKTDAPKSAEDEAAGEAKNREIAAALSKEAGYRSVVYQGKGKFLIDYAVSGTLTHSFVFPYNSDAEAIFPFLAIEVRQGGLVRVKAPGFAGKQDSPGGGMGTPTADASKFLDGTFTLDTDAEIVSQNNEDGAKTVGGRRQIAWRATPLTKDAPTAVLRLKP